MRIPDHIMAVRNIGNQLFVCIVIFIICVETFKTSEKDVNFDPKCCGPKQWEAKSFETDGYLDNELEFVSVSEVENDVHYDYINKKLALEQHIWNATNNETFTQRVVINFKRKLKWTITEKQCQQEVYTIPMTSPCIPGVATFIRSERIGDILADVYKLNDTLEGSIWSYTVSAKSCIQLAITRLSQHAVFTFSMTEYDNITTGLNDKNAFKLPPHCLLSLDVRLR